MICLEKDSKSEVLRSFSNIKNVETKIYRVGNIDLWIPIAVETGCIYLISAFLVFLINRIVPIPLNEGIKYFAIPIVLTMIIKTAKIDGKNPHIYLLRLIEYKFNQKKIIERFEFREEEKEFEFE